MAASRNEYKARHCGRQHVKSYTNFFVRVCGAVAFATLFFFLVTCGLGGRTYIVNTTTGETNSYWCPCVNNKTNYITNSVPTCPAVSCLETNGQVWLVSDSNSYWNGTQGATSVWGGCYTLVVYSNSISADCNETFWISCSPSNTPSCDFDCDWYAHGATNQLPPAVTATWSDLCGSYATYCTWSASDQGYRGSMGPVQVVVSWSPQNCKWIVGAIGNLCAPSHPIECTAVNMSWFGPTAYVPWGTNYQGAVGGNDCQVGVATVY